MSRTALGLGLMFALGGAMACTAEGKEVATTFFDPAMMPSGNPPTTSDGDTEDEDTDEPQTGSATDDSDSADSGATTATTNTTMSESSGGGPVDEQPEDGMYSECATVADCIGLTTCVMVPGSEGGFCSRAGCGTPAADCDPNPGAASSAAPDCIDDGTGMLVCALSCAGGQTCPGGMQCLPVGVTMACA